MPRKKKVKIVEPEKMEIDSGAGVPNLVKTNKHPTGINPNILKTHDPVNPYKPYTGIMHNGHEGKGIDEPDSIGGSTAGHSALALITKGNSAGSVSTPGIGGAYDMGGASMPTAGAFHIGGDYDMSLESGAGLEDIKSRVPHHFWANVEQMNDKAFYHWLLGLNAREWEAIREAAHQLLGGNISSMWDSMGGGEDEDGDTNMGGKLNWNSVVPLLVPLLKEGLMEAGALEEVENDSGGNALLKFIKGNPSLQHKINKVTGGNFENESGGNIFNGGGPMTRESYSGSGLQSHQNHYRDIMFTSNPGGAARLFELEHDAGGAGFKSAIKHSVKKAKHILKKTKHAIDKGVPAAAKAISKGAKSASKASETINSLAQAATLIPELSQYASPIANATGEFNRVSQQSQPLLKEVEKLGKSKSGLSELKKAGKDILANPTQAALDYNQLNAAVKNKGKLKDSLESGINAANEIIARREQPQSGGGSNAFELDSMPGGGFKSATMMDPRRGCR